MFGGGRLGSGRFGLSRNGSGNTQVSRSTLSKNTSTLEHIQSLLEDAEAASELEHPSFSNWPDFPVVLQANPRAHNQTVNGGSGPSGKWLRVNPPVQHAASESIEFETDVFKGKLVLWLNGLKTSPTEVFAGKKRHSWFAFQGQFKREIPVDEVVSGQELPRPLHALPGAWFVENVLVKAARALSPSMQIGPPSTPYTLAPLIALAQVATASAPGSEPDITAAEEDLRLFLPLLSTRKGLPMSSAHRRAHFSKPSNLHKGLSFKPGVVWTFHFWQHYVDISTYKLDFIYKYNMIKHLAGQPLLIMAKHSPALGPASYLFNFQIAWHGVGYGSWEGLWFTDRMFVVPVPQSVCQQDVDVQQLPVAEMWHKSLADDVIKAAKAVEPAHAHIQQLEQPEEGKRRQEGEAQEPARRETVEG